MSTTKKLCVDFEKYVKEGKKPYILREELGSMSNLMVTQQGKIKEIDEKLLPIFPAKVLEMLSQPNVAVIKIIQQGWSHNKNYYDILQLKELVGIIEKQGSLQFKNHLEEGTKIDRDPNELVSYAKEVWYDDKTKAVYAAVKFPKDKPDTGWIFSVIQEDPEIIGVSIAAAVYVTEDFTKDGIIGDKIDGWAYFDSADYVLFASAGGEGIIASDIKEKINRIKEAHNIPDIKLKKSTKEEIQAKIDKIEFLLESIKSFQSYYFDSKAYQEISTVTNALANYLYSCWYALTNPEYDVKQQMKLIEDAFSKASDIITNLEVFKNPNLINQMDGGIYKEAKKPMMKGGKTVPAMKDGKPMMDDTDHPMIMSMDGKPMKNPKYSKTKEGVKIMKLSEFKTQDPEAYAELQKEAVLLAADEINVDIKKELDSIKPKVEELTIANKDLQKKIDTFEAEKTLQIHKVAVDEALIEAKLDAKAVTERFKRDLYTAKDMAEVKEMIEDRKKVVEGIMSGTTTHQEPPATPKKKEEVDKILEQIVEEVHRN